MKSIIISGVSGGMGFATAKHLTELGYQVYGLDIKEPTESLDRFRYIQTDLRSLDSVTKAYEVIREQAHEIEAIISMAGIYDLNSLIEMSEEDFIRIFDINVFAVYRLNKVFLPLLGENGKVIMVSSELAPLDPLPFNGIYSITKSTIEKYAFSLRMELQLLHKQVVVIRPGAVNTSLLDVSTTRIERFSKNTTLYPHNAARFQRITQRVESRKIPSEKIAKLVEKILNKKRPKYVYKINRNPLLLILNALPDRLQNWIIKQVLVRK